MRDSTDATSGAETPAQGVTLSIPTHMAAPSHGLILREGPKPTRPRGRIPRVARLLALAYHFEELLKTGAVETQAELAELAKLTLARVTQIMNLVGLAPNIQEDIFFLPPVTEGRRGHQRLEAVRERENIDRAPSTAEIMHPYDVFELNIERVTALVGTHTALHNKKGKPATVVSDVMRAAVVMTVSAIDAYLHGILKLYIARAAALSPPSNALLALINDWKLTPETVLAYIMHVKGPRDLTTAVEEHFADRTLQDPSKVADVFNLLGIADIWASVASALGRQEQDVRRQFANIVKRRHRIAHEADIDPTGRTATKKRALPRATAEEYRDAVVAVAKAMNDILIAKYP